MTKEELIKILTDLASNDDQEYAHIEADLVLLQFINDYEVSKAFRKIDKWYA